MLYFNNHFYILNRFTMDQADEPLTTTECEMACTNDYSGKSMYSFLFIKFYLRY